MVIECVLFGGDGVMVNKGKKLGGVIVRVGDAFAAM